MDLPLLLGTAVTENRRKARAIGYVVPLRARHRASPRLYGAFFAIVGRSSWRLGALLGALHAIFTGDGARQRAAAGRASAHGDAGHRRQRDHADRAARFPDAELRPQHLPRHARRAHRLRRPRRPDRARICSSRRTACTSHLAPRTSAVSCDRVQSPNHRLGRLSRRADRSSACATTSATRAAARIPGLWGFGPVLRQLGADFGFAHARDRRVRHALRR